MRKQPDRLAVLTRHVENIDGVLEEVTRQVSEEDWAAAKSAGVRLKYLEGVRTAGKEWIEENQ